MCCLLNTFPYVAYSGFSQQSIQSSSHSSIYPSFLSPSFHPIHPYFFISFLPFHLSLVHPYTHSSHPFSPSLVLILSQDFSFFFTFLFSHKQILHIIIISLCNFGFLLFTGKCRVGCKGGGINIYISPKIEIRILTLPIKYIASIRSSNFIVTFNYFLLILWSFPGEKQKYIYTLLDWEEFFE